jgi:hypothetical protein
LLVMVRMGCPYLKKTEVCFCEAFSKKMLITGVSRGGKSCQSAKSFEKCTIYKEHAVQKKDAETDSVKDK